MRTSVFGHFNMWGRLKHDRPAVPWLRLLSCDWIVAVQGEGFSIRSKRPLKKKTPYLWSFQRYFDCCYPSVKWLEMQTKTNSEYLLLQNNKEINNNLYGKSVVKDEPLSEILPNSLSSVSSRLCLRSTRAPFMVLYIKYGRASVLGISTDFVGKWTDLHFCNKTKSEGVI